MASITKRTSKSGKISYQCKVRLKGYPVQTKTLPTMKQAKEWSQDTESSIRSGQHFTTLESKRHTVDDMLTRYIEFTLPRKGASNQRQIRQQLEWWRTSIGHYSLFNTRPSLIAQCRDQLLHKGLSAATVTAYMAAFSHCLVVASSEWEWLESSPIMKVKKPKLPKGRERFLSDDERVRLLTACKASSNSMLLPIVTLALSTGMRRSEIMNLKRQNVNLNDRYILLTETKNHQTRRIPLVGVALNLLQQHIRSNYSDPLGAVGNEGVPFPDRWQRITSAR